MPILVGTASWTDQTLIKSGRFYPPDAKTPEQRLRFYASQFPVVEVDSIRRGKESIEINSLHIYNAFSLVGGGSKWKARVCRASGSGD